MDNILVYNYNALQTVQYKFRDHLDITVLLYNEI